MKFSKGYWWAACALVIAGAAMMWTAYSSALHTQASVTEHSETMEFFDINDLDIHLDAAALRIHADPSAEGITVMMNNMPANTIYTEYDGSLSISQNGSPRLVNFFWPGSLHTGGEVSVTLPPEELDAIFADVGFGDIVLEDVQTEELNLQSGAGDIGLTNVSADTAQIDCSAGDVTCEKCELMEYWHNQGAGDLTLNKVKLGETWLSLGMGDLSAENIAESGELHLESGAGSAKFRECYFGWDVWMELGAGDLTMSRTELHRPLEISCGAGSVSLELYGKKEDFVLDANVLGTITCDGVRSGSHIDSDFSGDYESADPGTSFRTDGDGVPITVSGVGDFNITFIDE